MNFRLNYYHINAKEDQISFSFGVYDGKGCKAVKRNMVSESCQKIINGILNASWITVHMQFCVIKKAGSLCL